MNIFRDSFLASSSKKCEKRPQFEICNRTGFEGRFKRSMTLFNTNSCLCVTCISVTLFISLQLVFLLVHHYVWSSHLICTITIIPGFLRESHYCALDLSAKRALTIRTSSEVGYFLDPVEPRGSYTEDFRDFKCVPEKPSAPQSLYKSWETANEAIAALNAAVDSRKKGNLRKAENIIRHAFALAPTHPDILTEYGVVVEMSKSDIVEAEELYTRALNYNPKHVEALTNRERTLPVVKEIDKKMLDDLHRKRMYFLRNQRTSSAVRRVARESYFLHVYHTVAIEGNTMSVGQTRSILETRMAVAGKSILEHNEILGMDAALRFINQTVFHMSSYTVEDILSIHRRVLGFADPEAAGVFRTTQVFVGSYTPTSAELVPSEMEELIRWLNDAESMLLDPIERAAIAHYKLARL